MKGARKYRFSVYALIALAGGYLGSVAAGTPPELFEAFGWALCGLVVAHGGTNGVEHLAEALKTRKGAP